MNKGMLFNLFIGGLVLFLILNIISSQSISDLYFRLVDQRRQAAVDFLKALRSQPKFEQEMDRQKAFFGQNIESEVFQDEIKRQQRIRQLEYVLQRNPKARDVLYALYVLYNQEGKNQVANQYLKRAQEVDPNL